MATAFDPDFDSEPPSLLDCKINLIWADTFLICVRMLKSLDLKMIKISFLLLFVHLIFISLSFHPSRYKMQQIKSRTSLRLTVSLLSFDSHVFRDCLPALMCHFKLRSEQASRYVIHQTPHRKRHNTLSALVSSSLFSTLSSFFKECPLWALFSLILLPPLSWVRASLPCWGWREWKINSYVLNAN